MPRKSGYGKGVKKPKAKKVMAKKVKKVKKG